VGPRHSRPVSVDDAHRWMEKHAAHEPDRGCCTLFLSKHQFYAFEAARKPVASCSMSAELRASGKWIVLLSIAGT
jgi:hypothetical protein